MNVPNYSVEVKKLHDTGLFDLKSEHGQGAFTDACVSMLNGLDENWGHLIKKPGQTDVHDHGEDSALYKFSDGTAKAVDFIGGAGGSNPKPGWIVDEITPYKHADWFNPQDHGIYESSAPPQAPVYPSYEELGGDSGGILFTRTLEYDYRRAGRNGLDADCGAWQQRTNYDFLTRKVPTMADAIKKHRESWCQALGIDVP